MFALHINVDASSSYATCNTKISNIRRLHLILSLGFNEITGHVHGLGVDESVRHVDHPELKNPNPDYQWGGLYKNIKFSVNFF